MSMSLSFAPSAFLGLPAFGTFFKPTRPPAKRQAQRVEPAFDHKKIGGTYPAVPAPVGDGKVDVSKLLAAVRSAPDLAPIEWDGDRAPALLHLDAPGTQASVAAANDDPRDFDSRRRKIRDRYIGARFPGVARNGADLASPDRVVKAARLYFEEHDSVAALELLDLAIEEVPHATALWLARIEILFLVRDRDGFVAAARAFREAHAGHPSWGEIERLGRAIAPFEALFGECAARDHEHYGPWPHLPNWIQAPWDLTGEVAAVDFHRAMSRLCANSPLLAAAA